MTLRSILGYPLYVTQMDYKKQLYTGTVLSDLPVIGSCLQPTSRYIDLLNCRLLSLLIDNEGKTPEPVYEGVLVCNGRKRPFQSWPFTSSATRRCSSRPLSP